MVNIFTGSEIVRVGIQIEKNGRDFYRAGGKISKSDKTKRMFQHLAAEEEKHIKVWEDIFSKLGEKYEPPSAFSDDYFAYLRAFSEEYVFTKQRKGEEIAQNVEDELETVKIGINAEKDSILFYNEMRKLVLKDAQETIDKLIEEEQKHLRKLSELKNSLSSQGA